MTGHKTRFVSGKWALTEDGKIVPNKRPARMSVSKRIAQRKSKKTKVVRRTV